MKKRDYKIDYTHHTFIAEDDWGDYCNGRKRKPRINKSGYCVNNFKDINGKRHGVMEHVVKWIFFNGDIPEGYEIDHIVPVKNGGTNKLSNLRMVTHKDNCNNEISKDNYKKAHLDKKFTEEHRRKIGLANKGKKKMLGKHHSEETKKKISEVQKNCPDKSKKVCQYSLDGTFINEYPSISEAARQTGIKKCGISSCLNNRHSTAGNYIWKIKKA